MSLANATPLGRYQKKVELQRPPDPPLRGATGEKLRQYVLYASSWASIQPTFGSTGGQGPIAGASQSYVVCLPWSLSLWQAITPAHRVCWTEGTKQRTLEIKTVTNFNEANIEIRLQCVEVLA